MKRLLSLSACLLVLAGLTSAEARVGVEVRGNVLLAQVARDTGGAQVTVTGPDGFVLERSFAAGEAVALSLADTDGVALADGQYRYQITFAPREQAERRSDELAGSEAPIVAGEPLQAAGTFQVKGGSAALPIELAEPPASLAKAPAPDTTFTDSLCVGFDCPASPTFSDTTILLMENNTRIKFDDTSSLGGFPNRDWSIVANDSASGGQNRIFIQDCGNSSQGGCSGNAVFTVEAGARANALYVDDGGRVGLGTNTPVLDIHDKRSNTPSIRLEQDSSGGFSAQSWDIAGNETNFFVRDVTSGSRLPFRIRPGAPTSSIDINTAGNVGVGTASPTSSLHVRRTDGTSKLTVEEASATAADRVLMVLNNTASNNKSRFLIQSGTGANGIWSFDNNGQALDSFSITRVGAGTNAFTLTSAGNLTIAGTLTQNSDRTTKDGIVEVDPAAVLAKVTALPISTWHYKGDAAETAHMGPMAQDFAAAFGLGQDDRHIAPVDMGGVALAAIKALNQEVTSKDAEIRELRERLARLEAALQQR